MQGRPDAAVGKIARLGSGHSFCTPLPRPRLKRPGCATPAGATARCGLPRGGASMIAPKSGGSALPPASKGTKILRPIALALCDFAEGLAKNKPELKALMARE